jgi:hypothetical protein
MDDLAGEPFAAPYLAPVLTAAYDERTTSRNAPRLLVIE